MNRIYYKPGSPEAQRMEALIDTREAAKKDYDEAAQYFCDVLEWDRPSNPTSAREWQKYLAALEQRKTWAATVFSIAAERANGICERADGWWYFRS